MLIDLRNLRRKLDGDAEIEHTVAPSLRSTSGGAAPSTQSASMNADGTMSAEYVLTEIRQHKLVTAVSLVVLVKQGRYDEALAEAQNSAQLSTRGNATLALLGHVYARLAGEARLMH